MNVVRWDEIGKEDMNFHVSVCGEIRNINILVIEVTYNVV